MFGAYLSAVGVSVVFLTLFIVAAVCIVARRLFQGEPKAPPHVRDLRKVAAIATVHCYIDDVTRSGPGPVTSGTSSRWSVVARAEATLRGVGE